MKGFVRDEGGNVAVIFGLCLIPIFGLAGVALDYSRASSVHNSMQSKADAAALNVAVGGKDEAHAGVLARLRQEIENSAGGSGQIRDVSINGYWAGEGDFVVEIVGTVGTAMVHILPGVDEGMRVAVQAIARVSQETLNYEPPTMTYLDPDAGDYNQMYAYCFAYDQPGPKNARRSQMTLIADNEGTKYDFEWPKCGEGESLSFRMRNVRHARSYPALWNNRNQWPYRAEYDYFTDTVIAGGAEHISVSREVVWQPANWPKDPAHKNQNIPLLETVLCDSLDVCKPQSQGGVIPEGTNRNPQVETRPCEPGKYMYFGWEDRPPGMAGASGTWTDPAWTDRDYDDIRIVMRCPSGGGLGDRLVRLVR